MNPASLIRWRAAGIAAAFLLFAASSPADDNAPASGDVAALKSELVQTQDKLDMALRSYTLVSQENDKLKEQMAQNVTDANRLKEAVAAVEKAGQEVAALRAALQTREAENARLREVLRQTQDTNAALGTENAKLKARSGTGRP